MLSTIALMLLATTSGINGTSYVQGQTIHIKFDDFQNIYGPFKFYVTGDGVAAASACSDCPSGVTASYVVEPTSIYQQYMQGGKYVDVSFPITAVGGMETFNFTAVTCVVGGERFLATGSCPNSQLKGGRAK
jgi:hypothetical protein